MLLIHRLGPVHRLALGLMVVWSVVGCAAEPATPVAVAATIEGWKTRGVSCSEPTKDDVSSGLLQWSCRGTMGRAPFDALIDGDDAGVFQIVIQVRSDSMAAVTAADYFADLMRWTPPVREHETELQMWIRGWDGTPAATTLGTISARLDRDETWMTLVVVPGPRHSVTDPVDPSP
jgi:hypothetical protein